MLKLLKSLEFDMVVFDTAPTGHTLRLLSFPSVIEKGMGKMMGMQNKFGGLFSQVLGFGDRYPKISSCLPSSQVQTMMGAPQMDEGELSSKLEQTKGVIEEASRQFKNPVSGEPGGEIPASASTHKTISIGAHDVYMCDDS